MAGIDQPVMKEKQTAREPSREPAREKVAPKKLRPGEALGRDGTVLRRNKNYDDQFSVPDHVKEAGWSYQWNRKSCYGKEDRAEMSRMYDNGWRPVPQSRFGFDDSEEHIEREGLILMERPQALTDEANEEDRKAAADQYMRAFRSADTDARLPELVRVMRNASKRGARERVDPSLKPKYKPQEIPADEIE